MPSPNIAGVSSSSSGLVLSPPGAPADVSLPPDIVSGDLLLLAIDTTGSFGPSKVITPAGWTELFSTFNTTGRLTVLFRWADGAEGSQVNVGLVNPAGISWSAAVHRITGADPTKSLVAGASVMTTAKNPDPPNLNLPQVADVLWVEVIGIETSGGTVSTWSTGYDLGQVTISSGPVAQTNIGTGVGLAGRQSTANSENPDQCTIVIPTVNARWIANTIAVIGL